MIPTAAKLAILGNENNPGNNASVALLTAAASSMGFKTDVHILESGDFTTTFTAILRERPDVLYVIPDHFLYTQRARIIDFTMTNRTPAIFGLKEYVVDGGLVAAGPNRDDLARRAAALVDKILKGANPSDLPVEQPTKFELVINLETAKALGLTVPPLDPTACRRGDRVRSLRGQLRVIFDRSSRFYQLFDVRVDLKAGPLRAQPRRSCFSCAALPASGSVPVQPEGGERRWPVWRFLDRLAERAVCLVIAGVQKPAQIRTCPAWPQSD